MTGMIGADDLHKIRCNIVHTGRFVSIFFDHPGALTVCEFQVFGGKFPLGINFLKYSSEKISRKSSQVLKWYRHFKVILLSTPLFM